MFLSVVKDNGNCSKCQQSSVFKNNQDAQSAQRWGSGQAERQRGRRPRLHCSQMDSIKRWGGTYLKKKALEEEVSQCRKLSDIFKAATSSSVQFVAKSEFTGSSQYRTHSDKTVIQAKRLVCYNLLTLA